MVNANALTRFAVFVVIRTYTRFILRDFSNAAARRQYHVRTRCSWCGSLTRRILRDAVRLSTEPADHFAPVS